MKNKLFSLVLIAIIILLSFNELIYSQAGTYYDALNTGSSSFITDLETRIRSPYTKISYDQYDETNIANFASYDNGDGTRSVFCVYTHYEYIYTPPFTWLPMSREHTYCYSWQPGYPSTSLPEYSDQYHIFPVNQNNSNVIRNNHPLGIVVNVQSTFLDGKFGTDSNGKQVYEPRDEHKGDAARALLYMPVRYNGINGYDWTFNWLNGTRLPSLSEGSQDLATLLAWNKQDPPDKWEVDRSDYIQSIQGNRNPFVDHPEYVNYIDFNDLSKLNPTYSTEPANHATNFSASTSVSSITFSWTDATAGSQSPSNYLLIVYNRDNYFLPIDGETYSTDTDLSDGRAVVNISYAGADSYELTGLSNNTTYYGTIFSYNGSGTATNYKINGTLPRTSVTFNNTLAAVPTNHITNFAAGTITTTSIQLTWTDAVAGSQVPEGYILFANKTGTFSNPAGGTVYTQDTDLSDGSARVYILYSDPDNYTFSGLAPGTTYYFKMFSYNGTSTLIDYKTDGTVPTLNAQTTSTGGGSFTDLIFSEYVEGSSNNKALEIFNGTASTVDLSAGGYKIEIYFNGSSIVGNTINLTGSITAGNVFVICHSSASAVVLAVANQTSSSISFNGDDAVVLKKGSTILDVIGQVGYDPGTEWGSGLTSTADNTLLRKATVTQGDTNPNDAFDPSVEWDGYAIDTFDGLGSASPLPVELIDYSAKVSGDRVILNWATATEVNNYGFEVERMIPDQVRNDNAGWVKVGFVAGAGNSNSPKSYTFTDQPSGGKSFSYRLKQLDNNGKYRYYDAITVLLVISNKAQLMQNNPNPFNPSTVIKFYLPNESNVKIQIFDILGKEINVLLDSKNDAGYHLVYWNGRNKYGKQASSGVYFYRLTAGNFIETKKMLMMK